MSILLHQLPAKRFYSKHFTLSYMHLEHETLIYMRMQKEIVNTSELPQTIALLEQNLPSIFTSKCFNKKKFGFKKEARRTEIGHLLEHIVLEYLCCEKMKKTPQHVVYSGVTAWDWTKDKFGTFHITIDATISDQKIFAVALEKGILLLNQVLNSYKKDIKRSDKFLQTESRNILFA